jgi:PAS domain S-box-containing protein
MHRVLLLVEDVAIRIQIMQWLASDYEVIGHFEPTAPALAASFDAVIVDMQGLRQHRSWLQSRRVLLYPALSPCLLITPRSHVQEISEDTWKLIDDLIVTPVDRLELQARLRRMLLIHAMSLELKHNNETLVRIQKAVESTSDAVSIANMEGVALYHNQAFHDLYGYTVNELNVHGIPETLFVNPAVANDVFDTVLQGESWQGEVQLRRKTGEVMPALLRANQIEDEQGDPIGIVVVYTDMNQIRRVEAAERQQRVLAEALRDAIATITSTLSLDEVLDLILEHVGQVVPHDAANIMLLQHGEAYAVRTQGYDGDLLEHELKVRRFPVNQSASLLEILTGQNVIIVDDIREHTSMIDSTQSRMRSYIGAPILFKGQVIGLINLNSKASGFFKAVHAGRLKTFAQLVGTAIVNAQLFEQAQELAVYKERQRMARDLHDAVSQTLFSASGIAQALPRIWQRDPDKVWPRLEQLERLTRGALAEMRTLLYELRPDTVQEVELPSLMQQLAEGIMGHSSVRVEVKVKQDAPLEIPPDVHINFYQITREGLNNVVKHSGATQADIDLYIAAHGARLTIRDNGSGFDVQQTPASSLGLKIMNERAAEIGALLQIESHTGRGTTIAVNWSNGEEGIQ